MTRQKSEAILIGDEVRITVLETQGDTVRLGIEAPRDIEIHCEEIVQKQQVFEIKNEDTGR